MTNPKRITATITKSSPGEPLHDNRSDIGIVLSKVGGAREGVALMKRERN